MKKCALPFACLAVLLTTAPLAAPAQASPAPRIPVAPTGEAVVPPDVHPEFAGGEKASVQDHPFIIAGLREGGDRPLGQTCTGSVIAPRKILIAAHCAGSDGEMNFLYGLDDLNNDADGFRTEAVDFQRHPKYENFIDGYDVGVATTADDIPVPDGKFAEFATSEDAGLTESGGAGYGLGYGRKEQDDSSKDVTLEKAELPIVDEDQACEGPDSGFKPELMLCAGYPDGKVTILPGDSGGPLIVEGKVVGVASWTRGGFNWYSVYGRLTNEMGDWVREQLNS